MAILEFKKHKENYEINLFENKNSKSHYNVIVNRDPKQLAQILVDLHLDGFKIEEAIKIFFNRIKNKDWLGF